MAEPVAIASNASEDPRFKAFKNIPEDHEEVRLLSTLGVLVGAEIERARLESEYTQLTTKLETRKMVDRAKGILQRDLSLTEEEAYQKMQRESRQRRKSMREIADAILLADDLRCAQSTD